MLFISKKKLNTFILGFSLLNITNINAASLSDIYQQALKNDAEYKVAKASLASGKLASKIGRAGLLPQVGFSAEYSDTDSDVSFNGGQDNDNDSDRTTYGISLSQPLFNAAAWHQFKRSKTERNISELNFGIAQQQLILRTANAYFESLRAIDNLATAKAEEDALSHSLEQTKQRFEVGLTAITEVHEAQAAYDSARANRLIADGDLVIAMEALEVLTRQAHSKVAPLKSSFPVTVPEPYDRSSWVAMALKTNLELNSAKIQLKTAKQDYKIARAGHLPTVTAELGYSDTTNNSLGLNDRVNPPAFGNNKTESASTTASITLSLPLFTGGRTSAQRQQAAHGKVAAQETVNQTEHQIIQQTRSLHQRVNTGVATVKARQQAIVSSESALEATKAGYDVGTRNLVDVLDAQRRVYASRRDYLSTLYDYILSGLQLKQAAGTLSATDVNQLDNWLNKEQLVGLPAEKQP